MLDVDYPTVFQNLLVNCGSLTAAEVPVFTNVRDLGKTDGIVITEGVPNIVDYKDYQRLEQNIGVICSAKSKSTLQSYTHAVEVAVNYFNNNLTTKNLLLSCASALSSTRYEVRAGSVKEGYTSGVEVPVGTSIAPWVSVDDPLQCVVDTMGGYKCWKVYYPPATTGYPSIARDLGTNITTGTLAFKVYLASPIDSSGLGPYVTVKSSVTPFPQGPWFSFENKLKYYDASVLTEGPDITANVWHDVTVNFACSTNKWDLLWDGAAVASNVGFYSASCDAVNYILENRSSSVAQAVTTYYTQWNYSWAETEERAYFKYTFDQDLDSIVSATVLISAGAAQSGIGVSFKGIEGTLPSMASPEGLWTASLTTASVVKTSLATGNNSFDVASILQEVTTSWDSGDSCLFSMAPSNFSATEYTLTAGTLTYAATLPHQPDYIQAKPASGIKKYLNDSGWGEVLNFTMIYYAMSKETS